MTETAQKKLTELLKTLDEAGVEDQEIKVVVQTRGRQKTATETEPTAPQTLYTYAEIRGVVIMEKRVITPASERA